MTVHAMVTRDIQHASDVTWVGKCDVSDAHGDSVGHVYLMRDGTWRTWAGGAAFDTAEQAAAHLAGELR